MRINSFITSCLLVTTAMLSIKNSARAETPWAKSPSSAKVQSMATKDSDSKVNSTGTAVVQGSFYLVATSCVGASDSFNALLYVNQRGSRFVVQDASSGLRFKGRGSRRGFSVKAKVRNRTTGDNYALTLTAGPVLSDYTANLRYSAKVFNYRTGGVCSSVFEGDFQVN